MKRFVASLGPLLALLLCTTAPAQDIKERLERLTHVVAVTEVAGRNGTTYDIAFEQPVDHADPNSPKFRQHLYLAHSDFAKPMILGTEGYSANRPSGGELSRILNAPNVLTVEHRYFGRSIPDPLVWKFLTVKNAADDMHEIVTSFKQLYTGKWVSTGASKGGQTALYFKCYYPNDVDATVAYVAPINVAQEDPRIIPFVDSIGDEAARKKIKEYQIDLLKREDEVIAALNVNPADYSMGVGKAFEFGVLEFPFAFWQYGSKVDIVPAPGAPVADLVAAFKKVNPMSYYSDRVVKQFEAFQYQAFTEVGYYNYDITDLKPYLKSNPNPTNMDLCPAGTKDTIVYNPATMAFVYHYLLYNANNIIYVYGETDAWSSTQMQLLGRTNAIKIVVAGAWHNASIRAASESQKKAVYDALDTWMGGPINRL